MPETEKWQLAKEQTRKALIGRARLRGMIPYSDLAPQITALPMRAHDVRLFNLLGEISREEDAVGRGMLSVIVVHKVGDMQPGPGFFELAHQLGRDTSDILRCWIDETKKVHAFLSKTGQILS